MTAARLLDKARTGTPLFSDEDFPFLGAMWPSDSSDSEKAECVRRLLRIALDDERVVELDPQEPGDKPYP